MLLENGPESRGALKTPSDLVVSSFSKGGPVVPTFIMTASYWDEMVISDAIIPTVKTRNDAITDLC